ncbi:hypothetical protein AB0A05_39070, partial [Streptomyces sp. NPDC046374]|uniref:hypothetical protein n=1 Tax=Streptomyces sp. NPDC046374 TaxID=3154917 RepID=UPI0033C60102
ERVLRADREARREAFRIELREANLGMGLLVIALVVVVWIGGVNTAAIVAGAAASWFVLAWLVVLLRGGRGRDALRRAYIGAFGWLGLI